MVRPLCINRKRRERLLLREGAMFAYPRQRMEGKGNMGEHGGTCQVFRGFRGTPKHTNPLATHSPQVGSLYYGQQTQNQCDIARQG